MTSTVIRAEGLSKQYTKGIRYQHDTLRDVVGRHMTRILQRRPPPGRSGEKFWALRDVSFEVTGGEVVGIIGRNGAGKSTLLRILSRVTEPTAGFAEIRGRVGSLIEVGTGFHPELTGLENIYLNGAILGMKKAEIERKRDEIVAFAGVEEFIHTPVKRYSSGMYMRLAFAVAAHLELDILLVDEVLAVGDADFQKKCLGKMEDVAKGGRTVICVSHNMGTITHLCDRALWIHDSRLMLDGSPSSVVSAYLSSSACDEPVWTNAVPGEDAAVDFRFTSVRVLSMVGQPTRVAGYGQGLKLEIAYELSRPLRDFLVLSCLENATGATVWTSGDSDTTGRRSGGTRGPGRFLSVCTIPPNLLKPGVYHLDVAGRSGEKNFPWHDYVVSFEISAVGYAFAPGRDGIIAPLLQWEVSSAMGRSEAS